MVYTIKIAEKLEKQLKKILPSDKERILERIDSLAYDPHPEGCKKLQGNRRPTLYRARSGGYSIIYTMEDSHLIVLGRYRPQKRNLPLVICYSVRTSSLLSFTF